MKKEAVCELIKVVASTFISNYLPTDVSVEDVWKKHCDDLLNNNFYGYSTYSENGGWIAKSVLSDRVLTVENDAELKKEVLNFITSLFTLDILKKIEQAVSNVDKDQCGNQYDLDTDIKISNGDVTIDFGESEERAIPYFIQGRTYGEKDIKVLHVSVNETDTPDLKESYDNCVRYNLGLLASDARCVDIIDMTVIHLRYDAELNNLSVTVKSEECGEKVKDMTYKVIQDKINSFLSNYFLCR